jgi:hypothetical protein
MPEAWVYLLRCRDGSPALLEPGLDLAEKRHADPVDEVAIEGQGQVRR